MSLDVVWRSLVRPHPSIEDPFERRRAVLLASTMLVIVPLGVLMLGVILVLRPQFVAFLSVRSTMVSLVLGLLTYLVNRMGRRELAGWMAVLNPLVIFTVVPFIPGSPPAMLGVSALAVIFAGFFFSMQTVLGIAAFHLLLTVLCLVIAIPTDGIPPYLYVVLNNLAVEASFIVFVSYQNNLERERRASLEQANARLQAVFDNSPAVILLANPQGQIERINLSQELNELVRGQAAVNFLLTDASKRDMRNAIERAVSHGERSSFEVIVHDPRGPMTWTNLLIGPVRIGDGPVEQVMCVIQDISERKENEERMRRINLELEERVAQRTAEYRQAKERAEQADLVKSQFLASMSHELRTPLNAVINLTEITRKGLFGPVNEEQAEMLGRAVDSGQHLLALINDVLDITKMSSGKMTLFLDDRIDLYEDIEQALSATRALIGERPVTLESQVAADLPSLHADGRRVRQVLLNLLSNAAKFTEAGSIRLSVGLRDEHIEFCVSDTGPGIDKAKQELIFEPFVQSESGLKHQGGTGLGLAISRYIVEGHGGRIWVVSEPGSGAAFYFNLPLAGVNPSL